MPLEWLKLFKSPMNCRRPCYYLHSSTVFKLLTCNTHKFMNHNSLANCSHALQVSYIILQVQVGQSI